MTATTPKPKKPLWRRLLKWTLRCAIVLIVATIALYAGVSYWAAKTIHNEISRIRAAGQPVTFLELNKLTPLVDRTQDAAPFYRAASELVDTTYDQDGANYNALLGPEPLPAIISPEAMAWAKKALEPNADALRLMDQGSKLPGCNGDIQLEYGIAAALRPLGRTRSLANVGRLRTRSLAAAGNPTAAVDSLASTLGLVRIFDRQPVLIDALVQVALCSLADRDAQFILNHSRPDDATLQKLAAALQQVHLVSPRQIFIAERVFVFELNRNLIANGVDLAPPSPEEPVFADRQAFTSLGIAGRVMVANTLIYQSRYIDAISNDWPTILDATQKAVDSATSLIDKITAPSFAHAITVYGRSLAIHRATLIALEIQRYRLAHNQLPASLSDLPNFAAIPADPFTGKPLLYIKTPDGFCVISAGNNRPENNPDHIDRDADPAAWSIRWGIHVRNP